MCYRFQQHAQMYETYYQNGKQQKNMKRIMFSGENGIAVKHSFSFVHSLNSGEYHIKSDEISEKYAT
jgi:hypothetical protein